MVKKRKNKKAKQYSFYINRHHFKILLDKIMIFRLLHGLHGRFWGIAAAFGLMIGILICFFIRPDMLKLETAFSDFGLDVRTAPYFAGSVFFAAYGLWRWRNYLKRTIRRTRPILPLMTITILGLFLVALMPVSWHPWPSRLHLIGMAMIGISAGATVIFDILLSKTPHGQNAYFIRLVKMAAFLLIVVGGWLTLGSSHWLSWFYVAMPSEILMFSGYFTWILLKTYQDEDPRSVLSKILKKVILVD